MNHHHDGRIAVYSEKETNTRETVWQMTGNAKLGGPNWQKVRIPLPLSKTATKLVISANLLKVNQYVALDDFQIVNGEGQAMGCVVEPRTRSWKEWKLTDGLEQNFSGNNLRDDPTNQKLLSAVNWTSLDATLGGKSAELYSFLRKFRQATGSKLNVQERVAMGKDIMRMIAQKHQSKEHSVMTDYEAMLKKIMPETGTWKPLTVAQEVNKANATTNPDPWGVNQLLYEMAKDLLNLSGIFPQEASNMDSAHETGENWLRKIFG
ncbi:unnamed protein product [Soboliphyme baturini]|uniref:MAM domain-containing protein n=1 Tax=Soboliphyme baturini TaxID=241478 RepID=A0A183INL2_9BILA|nr:unnamed protein product [Soboliphyme baturini]